MPRHVLAGDIGGTKTNLAIYAADEHGGLSLVREASFASRSYAGLEAVLTVFAPAGRERLDAAAFGVAGPVLEGVVVTPNLPWRVEAKALARELGCESVILLNDLEATALGATALPGHQIVVVNEGRRRTGNRAVIAAGTGLGQAFLFDDGRSLRPVATEGGHADFAPRTEIEVGLWRRLRRVHGRVSVERVLSGPGLVEVFRFLDEELGRPVAPAVREDMRQDDPAAAIGRAGVAGTCATCREALEVFVSVYGAQAGNLALSVMARGGVYVGGGIVTKILPRVTTGTFMAAFTDKGRYAEFMSEIPVGVISNPKTALLGAARAAAAALAS